MSIFVTGSTGTIGQAVVHELLVKGIPLKVGVRSLDKTPAGVDAAVVDFGAPKTLIQAFGGADTLFLLTPDAPQVKTWVQNAVAAAKEVGVSHVVRSSGIGADPDSPYAVMRQLGELEVIIQESGLAWTALRPNSFTQNFATFDAQAIRHGYLQSPRGEAHISFVDVRDIAAVAVEVLLKPKRHEGKAYTLTGPRALTLGEVASVIGVRIGRNVTYTDVDEAVWGEQMRGWHVELLLSLYRADKNGVTSVVTDDVEQVTGRAPRDIKAFVEDYRSAWA